MSLVRVTPPGGKVRDVYGSVIGNVRTLIDYTQDETIVDRYACLLQVYDYTNGSLDTITINPSDATSTTWTENTDFNATTSNAQTASNIASAINATTNFSAQAIVGTAYDPYVSISYTGGGYITSASSGDTTAWEMQTINATNGTIAEIASDSSGTRKNQPIFTDSDGFWEFYIDNKGNFDLLFDKSGVTFDNSRYEDISGGGVTGLAYDSGNDEVDLSKTLNAQGNPINNVSSRKDQNNNKYEVFAPDWPTGADIGAQINDIISNAPTEGVRIILPAGSFNLSTEISLARPNIVIEGAGKGGMSGTNEDHMTELKATTSLSCMIDMGDGINSYSGIKLRGFTLNGNSNITTAGLRARWINNGIIYEDIGYRNLPIGHLAKSKCFGSTYRDLLFEDITDYNLDLRETCHSTEVIACKFFRQGGKIRIGSTGISAGIHFNHCDIETESPYQIDIRRGSNIVFENCYGESKDAGNVYWLGVLNDGDDTVRGLTIKDCYYNGGNQSDWIYLKGSATETIRGVNIEGGFVQGLSNRCIRNDGYVEGGRIGPISTTETIISDDTGFDEIFDQEKLLMPNLPTSDPLNAGELWVDTTNSNRVKQSQG